MCVIWKELESGALWRCCWSWSSLFTTYFVPKDNTLTHSCRGKRRRDGIWAFFYFIVFLSIFLFLSLYLCHPLLSHSVLCRYPLSVVMFIHSFFCLVYHVYPFNYKFTPVCWYIFSFPCLSVHFNGIFRTAFRHIYIHCDDSSYYHLPLSLCWCLSLVAPELWSSASLWQSDAAQMRRVRTYLSTFVQTHWNGGISLFILILTFPLLCLSVCLLHLCIPVDPFSGAFRWPGQAQ